jgi:hypothetical protein
MEWGDATAIELIVNNRHWGRVANLLDAGPDDAVYSLNRQTGVVSFGDGVQGARPPVGSAIIVSYRYGAGSAGNISKIIDSDGDLAKFWVIVRDGQQALGWGDHAQ